MLAAATARQPPPPSMRRNLRLAATRGLLVQLHLTDCNLLVGGILDYDTEAQRCLVEAPNTPFPQFEVDLYEVCELRFITAVWLRRGLAVARFAMVAPWRTASPEPSLAADLAFGVVVHGEPGVLSLCSGIRRSCIIADMHDRRCRLDCTSGLPPQWWMG